MREMLFRGRPIDGSAWVEGSLLIDGEKHRPIERPDVPYSNFYIVRESEHDNIKAMTCNGIYLQVLGYHVDLSTVGQYTGLCDKNGKKIFEGDVVKVTDDYGDFLTSDCGVGEVIFFDGLWYIASDVNNGLYDIDKCYYIEVIGNIHDNPELLEGEG